VQGQEQQLLQIADMLLLNGTLTGCPGLVHGKIGMTVFFFHYAQYTNNMLFADYALDLIGEVQNQVHVNSPADYEKGIAGIGVGIDYLIRNKFLIVEDDIFEDLDQRMARAVMHDPWQDFSLYDGLTGYGRYWISRLHHQGPVKYAQECLMHITEQIKDQLTDISEEEQADVHCFLHDLHEISGFEMCGRLLEQCRRWDFLSVDISKCFSRLGDSDTGNIIRKYQCGRYFNDALQGDIDVALRQISDLDTEKPPAAMGLLNGYAGEGLLRLTALGQTNMLWMQLL
jgi:hypothetical protein